MSIRNIDDDGIREVIMDNLDTAKTNLIDSESALFNLHLQDRNDPL